MMAAFDAEGNRWHVDNATEPLFGMGLGPTTLAGIHDPALCEGRGCVVHHPSDHHMRDWPITWRSDRQIAERTCVHGVGHPDPDDLAYREGVGDTSAGVHGCDGCCAPDKAA